LTPNELLLKFQEEHYSGYITAEELAEERKIVQEETKRRLLKKYQEDSPPEELKQYEKDIDGHYKELENIEIPTKYEDPEFYSSLLEWSSIIQSGISTSNLIHQETRNVVKLTDMNYNFTTPSLGSIAFGDVNAATIPCDDNEHLIIFQTEFATFCYLISKIIVQLMPEYDSTLGKSHEEYIKEVQEKISKNPSIVERFKELVTAYATTSRATKAPIYEISSKYNHALTELTHAMEIFAMGHEYAHILIGHTTEESYERENSLEGLSRIFYLQHQEYEADHLALTLTLEGLKNEGRENYFSNYLGFESFFSALEISERAKCIVKIGDDTWYWRRDGRMSGEIPNHPPIDARREKLRTQAKFVFGEKFLEGGKISEKIIKILYEKIKPDLVEIHNNS